MAITKGIIINQKIRKRVVDTANYIIENKSTVREAAKEFNVSKSTVHKDVSERLELVNPELYEKVREHLDFHKEVRHLRGGAATRELYGSEWKENSGKVVGKKKIAVE